MKEEGAAERSPMSTTRARKVAKAYAGCTSDTHSAGKPRIVIEYQTEGLSTGICIDFLSVYPKEKEQVYWLK